VDERVRGARVAQAGTGCRRSAMCGWHQQHSACNAEAGTEAGAGAAAANGGAQLWLCVCVVDAHLLAERLHLLLLVSAASDADRAQATVLAQVPAHPRHLLRQFPSRQQDEHKGAFRLGGRTMPLGGQQLRAGRWRGRADKGMHG
jgi:hypothetical protein